MKDWLTGLAMLLISLIGIGALAVLGSGCAEIVSTTTTTTIPATPPPADLSAAATTLQTTLSWEAVTGALSYNLYWSNTPGVTTASGTKIAGTTSPYTHSGLINAQTYYYVATAVSTLSVESLASDQAVATPETIGVLDAAFSGDGIVTHHNAAGGGSNDYGVAMAIDSSDRPVVAGYSRALDGQFDMVIWRYTSDGNLDTTFDGDGIVTHNNAAGGDASDGAYALTIDTAGRILITGYSTGANADMAIWRYNSDGSLDTTFNGSGFVTHNNAAGGNSSDFGNSITVDSSGKILVTGKSRNASGNDDMVIWRYNSDGSLDTTFAGNGIATHNNAAGGDANDSGNSITVDASGRVLVAGESRSASNTDMAIWRYNSDGSLDATFDGDGIVISNNAAGGDGSDSGNSIAIDPSGKILVAGNSSSTSTDMVIWRYNSDGSLDTTFAGDGIVVHDSAAGGSGSDYGSSIVIDQLGKILVGGESESPTNTDMAIWRYNPNGSLDTTFNGNGFVTHNNAAGGSGDDIGAAIAIDSFGRVLVAGESDSANTDMALWRYK